MASKKNKTTKYIFVVWGVMSSVGKGITASSIGKILQFHGLNVSAVKIDPYVNVDAGTMHPTEHGETFVLDDGYETDQDMGNYERFLGRSLTRDSYMTTGSVYYKVIQKERSLGYGGKCVDVVPWVPLAVIEQIEQAAKKEDADVVIVEIGGTLWEYQNILFLEAARMMKIKKPKDIAFVMVSYLPVPPRVGEMKTKPTQFAVRTMLETGLMPDFIVGRSEMDMDAKRKEKLAFSCMIDARDIISAPDMDSVYDVPNKFLDEGFDKRIIEKLGLSLNKFKRNTQAVEDWEKFTNASKISKKKVKIAIVGKYFSTGKFVLSDAYVSVIEALKYSAYSLWAKAELSWVDSRQFEDDPKSVKMLSEFDGVLVPGGFGSTGIEGKITAIKYVREHKIPYFGICYGMQLASVEFARNVCGIMWATSYEIDKKSKDQVVTFLPEQKAKLDAGNFGGSMRLWGYDSILKKWSLAFSLYGREKIRERHRHRYEINNAYKEVLEKKGFHISGTSPNGELVEVMELDKKLHPFFIGVQYHPEFLAHPLTPHPIFTGFIKASLKK